jgi:hypothetical protein
MKNITKLLLIFFLWITYLPVSPAQTAVNFCISEEEYKLFDEINSYRKAMGKLPLGLSRNLSFVASKHIEDILMRKTDSSDCPVFGWSYGNEGEDCCTSTNKENVFCSRRKPLFLTDYLDIAYEMVFEDDHQANAINALRFWKSIKQSKDMLLGEGIYSEFQWIAVGIAIQDKYVSLWLGEVPDLATKTKVCGSSDSVEFTIPEELSEKKFLSRPNNRFHIVLASAATKEEIYQKLIGLKESKLQNLRIINTKDRCRVITGDFEDRKEASSELKHYRKFIKDAWVIQY